jgi:hypothetical protein
MPDTPSKEIEDRRDKLAAEMEMEINKDHTAARRREWWIDALFWIGWPQPGQRLSSVSSR